MKATLHPEYEHEKKQHDRAATVVKKKLEWIDFEQDLGADEWSSAVLRGFWRNKKERLETSLREPFFGRVDWLEDPNEPPQTIYIGKHEITEANVFSWAAALPGQLYYAGVSASDKRQRLLKRSFTTQDDRIAEIIDEFIHPERNRVLSLSDFVTDPSIKHTDSFLVEVLGVSRESKMRDIVKSIQERQYRIISSSEAAILVVQGVPGSGKTAIALHRLPFLLFMNRDRRDYQPSQLLFLGPNNLLLSYISSVLPALGETSIPQMTFDEWLINIIGKRIDYQTQEQSLEFLLNPTIARDLRIRHFRSERLKSSLRMASLIERYVEHRFDTMLEQVESVDCEYGPFRWRFTSEDVRDRLNSYRHLPFNQRIDRVEASLGNLARDRFHRTFKDSDSDHRFRGLEPFLRIVRRQIDAHFEQWRYLSVVEAYQNLLRSPQLVERLGEGVLTSKEVELICLYGQYFGLARLSYGDLPAVVYLHTLVNGAKSGAQYRHIVVDEAQDITPLHMLVLKYHAQQASFTLVGDMTQSIFPQHGCSNWTELAVVAAYGNPERAKLNDDTRNDAAIHSEYVAESYRSTAEIVEYANALLHRTGTPHNSLARPVARSGRSPKVIGCKSVQQRVHLIHQAIELSKDEGYRSIAVICKTVGTCQQLARDWAAEFDETIQLIENREQPYVGGVVLLPVYLAKGMEFDVVIVADVDAESYRPVELDLHLLYVAITRAAHILYVTWIGQQSILINEKIRNVGIENHA